MSINFPTQFFRTNGIPLDSTTIFNKTAILTNYVEGTGDYSSGNNGTSVYEGQILVSTQDNDAKIYIAKYDASVTGTHLTPVLLEDALNITTDGTIHAEVDTSNFSGNKYSVGDYIYVTSTNKLYYRESTSNNSITDYVIVNSILDANGKIPVSYLPDISITNVISVADDAELLSIATGNATQEGDVVVVASSANNGGLKTSYLRNSHAAVNDNSTTFANWIQISVPDLVTSNVTLGDLSTTAYYNNGNFTVKLDAGETLGNYQEGDEIPNNTSIAEILTNLLQKRILPTYIRPNRVFSVTNNSVNIPSNVEAGYLIDVSELRYALTYDKNDGGNATQTRFYRDNNWTNVDVTVNTTLTADGTHNASTSLADDFKVGEGSSNAIGFSADWSATEGVVKNDNLGDPDTANNISAILTSQYANGLNGTLLTKTTVGHRRLFIYWGSDLLPVDSNNIRNSLNGTSSISNTVWSDTLSYPYNFTTGSGNTTYKDIVIAFPDSIGSLTKVEVNIFGQWTDVTTNFIAQSSVNVNGANNYIAASYKVYKNSFDAAANSELSYRLTIA